MADGEPVILRELGGRQREIVLEGAALPERGIASGVKQRLVKSHYPGSRKASVQMLGTSEDDIRITGRWDDMSPFSVDEALDPEVLAAQPVTQATASDGLDALDDLALALNDLAPALTAAPGIRGLF